MNKNLRFSWLCVLLMMFGIVSAQSTITFGDLGLENGVQYSDPFDGGDFTVTFSGGGNDGKYYNVGTGIRVYGNGTVTVAVKDQSSVITNIAFTFDGNNKPVSGSTTVSAGNYDYNSCVWTGSETEVSLTRASGSGHWRVKAVTVTVEGAGQSVPVPTISGETSFLDKTTVTLSTDVEGGQIYYTIDGTDPLESNSKQLYSAPFDVTETTTVKAYVVDATGAASAVAEKTFSKMRKYVQVNAIESGKSYLLVAETPKGLVVAKPMTAANYSWWYVDNVTETDGTILQSGTENEVVFTAVDGGYTLMQSDGRYLYQDGKYNNFYLTANPTKGEVWTVALNDDNSFTITNVAVNKWIQYSADHSSYGSYASTQDNSYLPMLYAFDDGSVKPVDPDKPVVETTSVTFNAKSDLSGQAEAGPQSVSKNGLTMAVSNGMLGNGSEYRIYKGESLTFTAPAGYNISKIEITCTANGAAKYGPGNLTASTGTYNYEGKLGTWTGNAAEVVLTAETNQVRATLIVVTLTGSGSSSASNGYDISKYPYASEESLAAFQEALEKLEKGEASDEEVAEALKDVARSHALAERLPEAEDLTSLITGDWTTELFTEDEGIEGEGYFAANGKDITARVYQTVELKAGRYMLTATGRGQQYQTIGENIDERLQVMAINNDRLERYQSIARTNFDGGVYGEGWDDASDFFTMTADGEAVIGARFVPKMGTQSWAGVGNFRLVRLGDATRYLDAEDDFYNDVAEDLGVVLHRALKVGEWNSLVLPFGVANAQLKSYFGDDVEVARFDGESDGEVRFTTAKDGNYITANAPVLVKPSKVSRSNLYVFDHVKMQKSVPADEVKGNFKFAGYYNPTQTPVEGGYGFDLVERNGVWTALTTTAVLLPVAEDAELKVVKVDDEVVFAQDEEEAEARLNVVGSTVKTDEPVDEPTDDPTDDPVVTGIDSIDAAAQTGALYNVAGQRVERPQKGLYIVGGKKVVLK